MNRHYLGVDLGATKLCIGELDESGDIVHTQRYPSNTADQPSALACITNSLDDYFDRRALWDDKPAAMGVGLIGRADWNSGTWLGIDSRRCEQIPVANLLSTRYGIPCGIENDVRCATRAEMKFGCGRDFSNLIYINIGTGIAAGTVIDGRITRGGHINAGEVGHTAVGVDVGTKCGCGRSNCVETIASGSGIDHCARMMLHQYPSTSLAIPPQGARVSVREVFDKQQSDPLCALLTENAARAIANLIMNLVRVTDPEVVVLGGGVMAGGFLYPRILSHLNKPTMRFVTGGVVLTQLDPSFAGVIGAGSVAMDCR